MAIITLTTDFGEKDYFVGAVKGAIYNELPDVRLVDISHSGWTIIILFVPIMEFYLYWLQKLNRRKLLKSIFMELFKQISRF